MNWKQGANNGCRSDEIPLAKQSPENEQEKIPEKKSRERECKVVVCQFWTKTRFWSGNTTSSQYFIFCRYVTSDFGSCLLPFQILILILKKRNEKWVPETRINYSFILILKFILILHLVKELFRSFIFYGLSWSFWDSHNFFIYIETRFCKFFFTNLRH